MSLLVNSAILAGPIVPDGSTNTSVISTNPHLIHISAPTANGTSINNYTHFNVPTSGAVLNNSPNAVFSQVINGQIGGNANLGGVSAKTIINQVTSLNPSLIEGRLEITGPKANLIIANPNGIKINGAQFLNTGITSLVTGRVFINSQADNDAINLITNSGEIEIASGGLSGFMDNLNLISKSLKIQGQIQNTNPRLSAGVQTITGDSNLLINSSNDTFPNVFSPYFVNMPTIASGANNPQFIVNLDGAGGITASKISVLVTDKGAGVNFEGGSINAKSDFEILADGKLKLKDHQIKTKGDTHLQAGEITTDGLSLEAKQNISLSADQINLQNSSIVTDNDLSFLGNLINSSSKTSLKAKGYLDITANTINFADTEINIGRKSEVIANDLTFKDASSTWQSEDINYEISNNFNNIGAAIDGKNSLSLQAINLNQSSRAYLMSSAGTINLDISNQINNKQSFIRSFNDLNLESSVLNNNAQAQIASTNANINITTLNNLINDNSLIQADKELNIESGNNINNAQAQILSTNANINIKTVNNLINNNSLIQADKELNIESGNNINNLNKGIIFSKNGNASLKAGKGLYNYGSRILSNQDLNLESPIVKNYTTQGSEIREEFRRKGSRFLWKRKTIKGWHEYFPEIDTEQPIIFANKNLNIKASNSFQNLGGQIIANDGNINITTKDFLNKAFRVGEAHYEESCRFFCSSKGYSNIRFIGGQISAGNKLNIQANNSIINTGGSLLALGDVSLKAPTIQNTAYPIYRFKKRYKGLKFWETSGWLIYTLDYGGSITSLAGKLRFYSDTPVENYGGLLFANNGIEASSGIEEIYKRRTAYKRKRGIGLFESFFRLI